MEGIFVSLLLFLFVYSLHTRSSLGPETDTTYRWVRTCATCVVTHWKHVWTRNHYTTLERNCNATKEWMVASWKKCKRATHGPYVCFLSSSAKKKLFLVYIIRSSVWQICGSLSRFIREGPYCVLVRLPSDGRRSSKNEWKRDLLERSS